ncbi:unnamed protein product [Paramecium pentaurelia]|uniref:Transmembrane protein n=1 Tax=Paramecium pentaurelia TaxID=43138 RepID=A0A8S1YKP2_9CILI|nr:unnamed protein product [Paramecium pentaurelia]
MVFLLILFVKEFVEMERQIKLNNVMMEIFIHLMDVLIVSIHVLKVVLIVSRAFVLNVKKDGHSMNLHVLRISIQILKIKIILNSSNNVQTIVNYVQIGCVKNVILDSIQQTINVKLFVEMEQGLEMKCVNQSNRVVKIVNLFALRIVMFALKVNVINVLLDIHLIILSNIINLFVEMVLYLMMKNVMILIKKMVMDVLVNVKLNRIIFARIIKTHFQNVIMKNILHFSFHQKIHMININTYLFILIKWLKKRVRMFFQQ